MTTIDTVKSIMAVISGFEDYGEDLLKIFDLPSSNTPHLNI